MGTVSGLALLAGGTALAATVGGDHQSLSATLLLGGLTLGLGHSLIEEIKRQARRESAGWTRKDTTNAVLLGLWSELALIMSILLLDTVPTRAVGLALAVAYAGACGYFVTERRRAAAVMTAPEPVRDDLPTTSGLDDAVPQRRHEGHVEHAPMPAAGEIRSAGPR
ncbi:hypothetical protein OWR29_38555 [Actinoplanes sp. Pm04-4]|uniref:Uncharacterized protein n=1 Tax=Paractinoplanes pyxinae TaxID=2997416 RepID=A0ABT4BBN8_9ACTN|nr:hypothetical protein [Actinoplanes pyxinae]MCY1143934.1 hypothetical protein [Actinoplanes pyxinae]